MNRDTTEQVIEDVKHAEGSVSEVAKLFLKLGTIAFGGPAAHIAMMHDEMSRRRRWVSEERFLDLLGATNLIPGPSSTEMAIYLGFERAGWKGLILGGVCFVLPAMLMVLAIAWVYVAYGTTPEATWLLYGIKPVIVAIIIQALWGLLKSAVRGPLLALTGLLVLGLYLLGLSAVALIFGSGLMVMVIENGWRNWHKHRSNHVMSLALASSIALPVGQITSLASTPFSFTALFATFL